MRFYIGKTMNNESKQRSEWLGIYTLVRLMGSPMKIIFLDFDGVMDTAYYDHI